MKASELIRLLHVAIERYGDLDVCAEADEHRMRIEVSGLKVEHDEFVFSDDPHNEGPIMCGDLPTMIKIAEGLGFTVVSKLDGSPTEPEWPKA